MGRVLGRLAPCLAHLPGDAVLGQVRPPSVQGSWCVRQALAMRWVLARVWCPWASLTLRVAWLSYWGRNVVFTGLLQPSAISPQPSLRFL